MEELLLYFSLKYSGDFDKIFQALKTKETVDLALKEKLFMNLKSKFTTIVSDDYPKALKYINAPPFVLYYYGNLNLVNQKCLGIVGMRQPSNYGIKMAQKFCKELVANNYVLVSGMALGIDAWVHQSAIDSNGKTIAILGSGIDYCYPSSNSKLYQELIKNQLVISEYPGFLAPKKENFPRRNRIISGLSESVLVIEANIRSGTMITVGHALEQGKDIYAIPGRIDDAKGCNYLIQQGAKLVMNVNDIIDG
ncbi:DNA-processing protein DprA [uncultured Thomasclavelia sp.]|uniref:DNA-processing protein DprA n=1 Tax=uncultured Thomasclavelia sp. TaxID=3025759 RepID=UPI0025F735C1|nr:DNA-processing protein DprA [uncultured Thomasclavelia sp.]